MRPFVLQPQTKNVPNSTQKTGTRAASLSVVSGVTISDSSPLPSAGAGVILVSP